MSKRIYDVDLMVKRALIHGPKTLSQLVTHTGMSRETIRMAMVRLKERGTIAGKDGMYSVVDERAAA